jgi:hypothetical protein
MAQSATSLFRQPGNHVEIVVHVDESLEDGERKDLVEHLMNANGINSAEFCPLRWHLMLVQYDRELTNSREVLGQVHARQVHAELIGPV